MPDFKRSGSRLISSTTPTARIQHYCSNEMPECSCHIIFPGDRYTREVWVHWWRADDYRVFSRMEIKKFHWLPSCHPDPESFESESDSQEQFHQLPLAA